MILKRMNDRALDGAIAITAAMLVLLVVGFGAYYYFDRYSQTSPAIVDNEIAHLRQAIKLYIPLWSPCPALECDFRH